MSLGELGRSFRLGGTLSGPKLELDPAGTALAIGRAAGSTEFSEAAGILSALTGQGGAAPAETGGADGEPNACLAAIAAGAGKKSEDRTREKPIEDIKKGLERTGEDLKKGARELEEGLKRLFGN